MTIKAKPVSSTPYQRKKNAVIRAVGRLYAVHPSITRFTMKAGKDGVIRVRGYKWYRESWMNEMLNAYRNLRGNQ